MLRRCMTRLLKYTGRKLECHETCQVALFSTKTTAQHDFLGPEKGDFGQPTILSHPHLLKEGELMPGIQRSEFEERRSQLASSITKQAYKTSTFADQHLVVIPAAPKVFMSQKVPYVYRQNSDFLYLSGCLEPESVLVLSISQNSSQHRSLLFLRKRDSHSELWDGPRTGVDRAPQFFGVDESLPIDEFEQYLNAYAKSHPKFLLWYDYSEPIDVKVHNTISSFCNSLKDKVWESPKKIIHSMRIIKSPAEQELMRKSCNIASKAISTTIGRSHDNITEHELFAIVDYECRMQGAEYLAYPPVVAGGERANIIHYINNSQVVPHGDMVLMDAGCEYHSYTSDITRTWPVSGKFTPHQRELYEALLSVQVELISLLKDQPTLDELFHMMCRLLGRKLVEIGVVSRKSNFNQDLSKVAFSFCPHHVSHYLGMDVHDTGLINRNIRVQPGMIVTVEPGIYISKHKSANPDFLGLGLRIEDDILITENGPEVLTAPCPKHPDDLELLVSSKCK